MYSIPYYIDTEGTYIPYYIDTVLVQLSAYNRTKFVPNTASLNKGRWPFEVLLTFLIEY